LPEDAAAGVGVTELEPPVFEDELLHETISRENTNAAKRKTFFIQGLHNKFQIVNESIGRFAILSGLPRLRFVRVPDIEFTCASNKLGFATIAGPAARLV
jgi:hypothetical protein